MNKLLGIDIGGTGVKLGLVSKTGQVEYSCTFPTQSLQSVSHFFQELGNQIQTLLQLQATDTSQLIGIGVGAPGHSTTAGSIIGAVNLPFREDIPIIPYLERQFHLPAFLLKDAKVAALGEKYWGAAKGMEHFVMLMLGTGLGYSAYSQGKIINGYRGLAGELGHSIIRIDGRPCNCGKKGCLETYLSATGLKRTAFEILGQDNRPSRLRQYSYEELNTFLIADLANSGDELAQLAFAKTAQFLGIQMANLTEQLAPEGFVISGGLAEAGDLLFRPATQALLENVQAIYRDKIKVLRASLPAHEVGILGAAALVLENIVLEAQSSTHK